MPHTHTTPARTVGWGRRAATTHYTQGQRRQRPRGVGMQWGEYQPPVDLEAERAADQRLARAQQLFEGARQARITSELPGGGEIVGGTGESQTLLDEAQQLASTLDPSRIAHISGQPTRSGTAGRMAAPDAQLRAGAQQGLDQRVQQLTEQNTRDANTRAARVAEQDAGQRDVQAINRLIARGQQKRRGSSVSIPRLLVSRDAEKHKRSFLLPPA